MNNPVIILGSAQAHCFKGYVRDSVCSCLTEAMGMGGGQIPLIIELYEQTK